MGATITLTTDLGLTDAYVAAMKLVGHNIHTDSFGNLITNIRNDDILQIKKAINIEVGNQLITGLSHTYAEGNGLLALIGSSGHLEVALKGGSASALLKVEVGDEVRVKQL